MKFILSLMLIASIACNLCFCAGCRTFFGVCGAVSRDDVPAMKKALADKGFVVEDARTASEKKTEVLSQIAHKLGICVANSSDLEKEINNVLDSKKEVPLTFSRDKMEKIANEMLESDAKVFKAMYDFIKPIEGGRIIVLPED